MKKIIKIGRPHFNIKTVKNINNSNNIALYIILLMSVISLFVGTIIYSQQKLKFFDNIIESYNLIANSDTYVKILLLYIKFDLLFILLCFFFGSSFLGQIFSIAVPISKCIFIGYISMYFYSTLKLHGILFCLIAIYPFSAITTTSLIYGAKESFYLSKNLYNIYIKNNTANEINIKLYLLRYFILIIINLICNSINAIVIKLLFSISPF